MIACQSGCQQRDRHRDDCPDTDTCGGCLARPAADGLQVCQTCEERARKALRDLPALWDDVQHAGVLKSASRGKGAGGTPLPIDPDAADWRTRVRACLVGWCLVLEEDFDATLDGASDTVAWMADKVGIYAGRILASEHADQLCSDLLGSVDDQGQRHGDLWGEGRRLAFKSRSLRGVTVPCPSCGERVRIEQDVEVVRCRCGEWGTPQWWKDRLAPNLDGPMPMRDLVPFLLMHHRVTVEPATVRQWVHRGKLPAQRDPESGEAVYNPIAAAQVAAEQGAKRAKDKCTCGHSRLKHEPGRGCVHVSKVDSGSGWLSVACSCDKFDPAVPVASVA